MDGFKTATPPKEAGARPWETRTRAKPVGGSRAVDLDGIPHEPEPPDEGPANDTGDDDFASSAKSSATDLPEEGPKKRGRKPGSTNKGAKVPQEIYDAGAAVLVIGHDWIALKTKHDRWELEDKEANQLSVAIINLLNYYGLQLDKKKSVWGALIVALIMIEGSRIMGEIVEMRGMKAKHGKNSFGPDQELQAHAA